MHGISIYAQSIVQIFEINKNGTGVSRGSTERLVTTTALALEALCDYALYKSTFYLLYLLTRDTIYCHKCLHVAWYVYVSVSLVVTTHP